MVEVSYQIPMHFDKVLGYAWIRIMTPVPEAILTLILDQEGVRKSDGEFGYSIHHVGSEQMIELKYPLKNRDYPMMPLWKAVEEIALMEYR